MHMHLHTHNIDDQPRLTVSLDVSFILKQALPVLQTVTQLKDTKSPLSICILFYNRIYHNHKCNGQI